MIFNLFGEAVVWEGRSALPPSAYVVMDVPQQIRYGTLTMSGLLAVKQGAALDAASHRHQVRVIVDDCRVLEIRSVAAPHAPLSSDDCARLLRGKSVLVPNYLARDFARVYAGVVTSVYTLTAGAHPRDAGALVRIS